MQTVPCKPLLEVPLRCIPGHLRMHPAHINLCGCASTDRGRRVRQVPYRPRLEEEVGGDPHATYAYVAADAAAKEKGTEQGAEVCSHVLVCVTSSMCGVLRTVIHRCSQCW